MHLHVAAFIVTTFVLTACATPASTALLDRAHIYAALEQQDVFSSSERRLVHLSHVCDLELEGKVVHIVDVRQLTTGGPSPRGLNEILALDASLQVLQRIEYVNARPLYCSGRELFTYGNVSLDASAEGNVLLFGDGGRVAEVAGQVEASDLAGMSPPVSRERSAPRP